MNQLNNKVYEYDSHYYFLLLILQLKWRKHMAHVKLEENKTC